MSKQKTPLFMVVTDARFDMHGSKHVRNYLVMKYIMMRKGPNDDVESGTYTVVRNKADCFPLFVLAPIVKVDGSQE
jgi:hypothetical protein